MFDLPEHFPIGVNRKGQGPVGVEDPHYDRMVCWCGKPGCLQYMDQCCCNWGAAVRPSRRRGESGEHPEFECYRCTIHGGTMAQPDEKCKRHRREEHG